MRGALDRESPNPFAMPYRRLTPEDATFLYLEDGGTPMHVASLLIFNGPPPTPADFTRHVRSHLFHVPRFRQKLAYVPFGQGRPVWVDDPNFHLDYHLRVTALPPPGDDRRLRTLTARIFSQRLDRHKPLWELYLVTGLADNHFALIGKTHHCLVDGVSGVDITTVLFDLEPDPVDVPATGRWEPKPEPAATELLADALLEKATNPVEILHTMQHALRTPRAVLREAFKSARALGAFASAGLSPAPPTPINRPIGPHRTLATASMDLDVFKEIKNAAGCTVNDVVLAVSTGALRRFLEYRGSAVDDLELKAMVPVSVRAPSDDRALGNKVAAFMARLPVYQSDPLERLEFLRHEMNHLKESRQAVGASVLIELTGFANATLLSQAARALQSGQRFFNLYITNVPGPQFPLYMLGRELQELYGMSPLAPNQALAIVVTSYNGRINFGLVGDWDVMDDIELFAEDVDASLLELLAAVRAAAHESPESVET